MLNPERSRFNLYRKLEIPGGNPWDPMGGPQGDSGGITVEKVDVGPPGGPRDAFRIAKMRIKRAELVEWAVLPPWSW